MRIDVYLTQYGHTPSRARAQQLISAGHVKLDGLPVTKAGIDVDETMPHNIQIVQDIPYVGRGGCKLEAALDAFGLSAKDAVAVDIGASTGGFTDCLLRRGAKKVYAVDSGSGQLAPTLLADERVVNLEKCNARYLDPEALGADFVAHGGADMLVMDVSFISQTYIHPVIKTLLKADGVAVTLIKPQFEVGRDKLGKSGIVKQPKWRREAVLKVLESAQTVGLVATDLIRSPIEGGDGNKEYLAYFHKRPCLASRVDDKTLRRLASL